MKKYRQLVGMPVFYNKTCRKVSEVLDLVISSEDKKITMLVVGSRMVPAMRFMIAYEDIVSIGNDAVMIREEAELKALDGRIANSGVNGLMGAEIYTQHGKNIGTVVDILFDEETGSLEGAEVSEGLLHDVFSGRNIIPFLGNVSLEKNIFIGEDAYEEMIHDGKGLLNLLGIEKSITGKE